MSIPNPIHYIEGPLGSGKTTRLIQTVCDLLVQHQADHMLVLCSNHSRQQHVKERCYAYLNENNLSPLAQPPIYTYAGYVRNMLFDYWPDVETLLAKAGSSGTPIIRPILGGLEDTERLLKRLIAHEKQLNPNSLSDFPGNESALIRQLVRRFRLRSENGLTRDEMLDRSRQLGQPCLDAIERISKQFDQLSYRLRLLDPNKQFDVFHHLIKAEGPLNRHLTQNIHHLIVDDVDETIPAQQQLIKLMAPHVETLALAVDIDGGSRRGYLNAYPYDWQALKSIRHGITTILKRTDTGAQLATNLLRAWEEGDLHPIQHHLEEGDLRPVDQNLSEHPEKNLALTLHPEANTRLDMLEQLFNDIEDNRWSPGDIAMVLPQQDPLFLQLIQRHCQQRNIPVQLLSGTQRPVDHPLCRTYVYLLQWLNAKAWHTPLTATEIKTILVHGLQLHMVAQPIMDAWVRDILNYHRQHMADLGERDLLPPIELLPSTEALNPEAIKRYRQLAELIEPLRIMSVSKQMYATFLNAITPFVQHRKEPFESVKKIIQSFQRFEHVAPQLIAEGLLTIEGVRINADTDNPLLYKQWLLDVKHGVLADTPSAPLEIDDHAMLIGTPQKLIDVEAYRQIYLWTDVGHREWSRSDNAPLYNAWVHSAVWDGSETAFTEEFNRKVIRKRAGHITRTLMLLATKEVHAYHSELDELGFDAHGDLLECLQQIDTESPNDTGAFSVERATLRPDQQGVLEYQTGTLAISAVPGAGKTFVNIELILELIERGTAPESILVLTYMDAAAKTMLKRLKNKLGHSVKQYPSISTIHGLAFRILTEHDHSLALLNLPNPLDILDDQKQHQLLTEVAQKTCPINHPFGDVSQRKWFNIVKRCIDSLKHAGISGGDLTLNLQGKTTDSLFPLIGKAVAMYRQLCREQGVIDFTDLITYAIQLLETHQDIRAYYQNQYSYIIEDEAQDSSQMLQRLIERLSKQPDDGSHPNLIRTGDTNQSITTTFSSADPTVFRDFIKHANQVVHMDASARCAPEVIQLANDWITHCEHTDPLQHAFAPTIIKPIAGANPQLLFPLQTACFDTSVDEQDWLTQTIIKLRDTYPHKSMAVLTLTNASVLDVTATLQAASLPAISLTDHMNNQPVFQVLFNTLQLLASPTQHQHQVALYKALCQLSEQRYALQFYATTTDDDDTTEAHREHVLANVALLYTTPQEITDPFLKQLYYDLSDFSRLSLNTNLPTLINHISQQWFINPTERSNGLLCALHCKQWLNQQGEGMSLSPLDDTLKYFTQLYQSPKGLKTFSDAAQSSPEDIIQVMTLHKSKGQEFDIVLMPALQEGHHQVNLDEQIATDLLEAIKTTPSDADAEIAHPSAPTTTTTLKQEERARLIFVGLTRAKQGLIATAHHKTKTRYGKFRTVQPDMAYYWLEQQAAASFEAEKQEGASTQEVPTS